MSLLLVQVCLGSLVGCDGSLAVSGQAILGETQQDTFCELANWRLASPIRMPRNHIKYNSAAVRGRFDVYWIISEPAGEHWLELTCSGHEVFRSATFRAPSEVREVNLGDIRLVPRQMPGD